MKNSEAIGRVLVEIGRSGESLGIGKPPDEIRKRFRPSRGQSAIPFYQH